MKDYRKERLKELNKYFEAYSNGEFDEDDFVIDELSVEHSQLEQELYNNKNEKQSEFSHHGDALEDLRECENLYNEGLWC